MPKTEIKKISKRECDQNMKIIMLEFEKKLMASIVKVTDKFHEALNKGKNKFAEKEEVKELSDVVKEMKKINEKRQYDWIRYSIVTAISIISLYLFNK